MRNERRLDVSTIDVYSCCLVGDLNGKIDCDGKQITALTPNGRLILNVINKHSLDVLNFSNKCKGKWTHVIRTTGAPSVLDYIMTCSRITKCVKEVVIDEECIFCPFKITRKNKKDVPQFTGVSNSNIPHTLKSIELQHL